VLEIGCGTGYYTQLLAEQGVSSYVGIDITDIFFPDLKKEYPGYSFLRQDITGEIVNGEYDLILMIDVIEHITQPEKLSTALSQVKRSLSTGGLFIIAPVPKKGRKSLFYVRFWSFEDILQQFRGFRIGIPLDFRYSQIVAIRKP
jgi:2-polyprenyl-3-methyl-5-hydroxy-6-metoxy-1,4-benzoquinol methylase